MIRNSDIVSRLNEKRRKEVEDERKKQVKEERERYEIGEWI